MLNFVTSPLHLRASSHPRLTSPLSSPRLRRRVPIRRAHGVPCMLTPITIATELLALSAVGTATYFLLRDDPPPPSDSPNADDASSVATPPLSNSDMAVLGLQSTSPSLDAISAERASPSLPPPPEPFDTVGVDINDYLDLADASLIPDRARRLDEELAWAIAAILDLPDCEAAVILDVSQKILLADGDLIADVADAGPLFREVSITRKAVVENVDGNDKVPFLSDAVRCVACVPVGAQGAALLLASRVEDCFGEYEQRVVSAVCDRLSSFLYVPPAIEG